MPLASALRNVPQQLLGFPPSEVPEEVTTSFPGVALAQQLAGGHVTVLLSDVISGVAEQYRMAFAHADPTLEVELPLDEVASRLPDVSAPLPGDPPMGGQADEGANPFAIAPPAGNGAAAEAPHAFGSPFESAAAEATPEAPSPIQPAVGATGEGNPFEPPIGAFLDQPAHELSQPEATPEPPALSGAQDPGAWNPQVAGQAPANTPPDLPRPGGLSGGAGADPAEPATPELPANGFAAGDTAAPETEPAFGGFSKEALAQQPLAPAAELSQPIAETNPFEAGGLAPSSEPAGGVPSTDLGTSPRSDPFGAPQLSPAGTGSAAETGQPIAFGGLAADPSPAEPLAPKDQLASPSASISPFGDLPEGGAGASPTEPQAPSLEDNPAASPFGAPPSATADDAERAPQATGFQPESQQAPPASGGASPFGDAAVPGEQEQAAAGSPFGQEISTPEPAPEALNPPQAESPFGELPQSPDTDAGPECERAESEHAKTGGDWPFAALGSLAPASSAGDLQPLETLSPLSDQIGDRSPEAAEPTVTPQMDLSPGAGSALSPFPQAADSLPEQKPQSDADLQQEAPAAVPSPFASSSFNDESEQRTLRALFMTDGRLDAQQVVSYCAEMPGVEECVALSSDGTLRASSREGGEFQQDAGKLFAGMRALDAAVGGDSGDSPLCIRGRGGLVSFFTAGEVGLGVRHGEEGFQPGVQERLYLVADELAALLS